jgi:hypothetical protein
VTSTWPRASGRGTRGFSRRSRQRASRPEMPALDKHCAPCEHTRLLTVPAPLLSFGITAGFFMRRGIPRPQALHPPPIASRTSLTRPAPPRTTSARSKSSVQPGDSRGSTATPFGEEAPGPDSPARRSASVPGSSRSTGRSERPCTPSISPAHRNAGSGLADQRGLRSPRRGGAMSCMVVRFTAGFGLVVRSASKVAYLQGRSAVGAHRTGGAAIRRRQPKAALLAPRTDGVHIDHRSGRVVFPWLLISRDRWLWGARASGQHLSGVHG